MWLNNIIIGTKALSPVELLVLTLHSDKEFRKSTDLLDDLSALFEHWNAEKGTIYPILHRLQKWGLLERSTGRAMAFRRSSKGKGLINSSTDTLSSQIELMLKYFLAITGDIVRSDPIAAKSLISSFNKMIAEVGLSLQKLEGEADVRISEDNWQEIPIE